MRQQQKPTYNAKTRLEHYKIALRNADEYPHGNYFVCINLIRLFGHKEMDIRKEYPEFYKHKPIYSCTLGSWFLDNEDRIKALKQCINELTDKIYRNELD